MTTSFHDKGKIRFSKYFQKFKQNERVSLVLSSSVKGKSPFPKRMQGRSGLVESKRGSSYIVNVKDGNKGKRFIVHPIHLNRVK